MSQGIWYSYGRKLDNRVAPDQLRMIRTSLPFVSLGVTGGQSSRLLFQRGGPSEIRRCMHLSFRPVRDIGAKHSRRKAVRGALESMATKGLRLVRHLWLLSGDACAPCYKRRTYAPLKAIEGVCTVVHPITQMM